MYSATNLTLQLFNKVKKDKEQNYDEVNVKINTQTMQILFKKKKVSPTDFELDSSHSAPFQGLEVH